MPTQGSKGFPSLLLSVADLNSAKWGETFIEKLSLRCKRPGESC